MHLSVAISEVNMNKLSQIKLNKNNITDIGIMYLSQALIGC